MLKPFSYLANQMLWFTLESRLYCFFQRLVNLKSVHKDYQRRKSKHWETGGKSYLSLKYFNFSYLLWLFCLRKRKRFCLETKENSLKKILRSETKEKCRKKIFVCPLNTSFTSSHFLSLSAFWINKKVFP